MPTLTLNQLKTGDIAQVLSLNSSGTNRRRLLDLGILPGTYLQAELRSPAGDPVAYRVRGSLIAIRNEQAKEIEVERVEGDLS